jgi:O-antigen ligase
MLLGPERLLLPLQRLAQSFSERDWSNLTRLYSMQAAWRAFLLSPVVGIGWGQFGWHFPLLVDTAGLQSQFTWPVVNSFPLQILCETGVTGFAVFSVATAALARAAVRGFRDSRRRARVTACAVATVGVWLQLLTFSQYNLPHVWLAPGLLLAALADGGDGAGDPA